MCQKPSLQSVKTDTVIILELEVLGTKEKVIRTSEINLSRSSMIFSIFTFKQNVRRKGKGDLFAAN
jgi:hypothetical protein